MAGQVGTLSLDGGDPRTNSSAGIGTSDVRASPSQLQTAFNPDVTFEEYLYHAEITRADTFSESLESNPTSFISRGWKFRRSTPTQDGTDHQHENVSLPEKEKDPGRVTKSSPELLHVSDEEYVRASRALRTATWGAVFYLITTDILGPYSTGWAFSQMGYGPGAALYAVFGAFAGYGGFLLWRMFLQLDSYRYPIRSYGDLAYRIAGTIAWRSVDILQSIQLLFNVAIIIVQNGQGLSQVSHGKVCFIVLCLVWAIAGMILAQIRTLARLGWLANFAVWLNVVIMIMTMVVVAHSDPNYEAAKANNFVDKGPVVKTAGPPADVPFDGQVVGLMQAVFSYGGAMVFIEFMAEMRRPFDFWKAMVAAQTFIFVVYLFFGLFVYSYQGRFTINPAFQGMSPYHWQTAGNVLGFVSTLLAALLYGNIGIKVLYNNVLVYFFRFPSLITKPGKLLWVALAPMYWGASFIIGAAIPQVSNLSGLVAAVCILQFTYTIPPILTVGFRIQKDALQTGEGYDPSTGRTIRHDRGFVRWKRGFMKQPLYNVFNVLYFLGSLATAVLGIYSAGKGIKSSYAKGSPPSFSCRNPVGA